MNSGAVDAVLGRLRDAFLHVYDLSANLTFAASEHLAVFKQKVRQAVMKGAGQK